MASSCSPTTPRSRPRRRTPTGRTRPASTRSSPTSRARRRWPITGATFILLHTKQDKPQNAAEVLKFFDWAFKNGQKMADELDYVAMPDSVTKMIADAWKAQIKDASGKAVWN